MTIASYLPSLRRFSPDSHKGQNGKVLLIGGSALFHAASRWSLDILSSMVDMVFYASIPENNELIRQAKGEFWGGVVVPRGDVESYIDEADAVLIGPGMERNEETERITNSLVEKYRQKKWVIDAGALQMIDPQLLAPHMIITPHHQEWERLQRKSAKIVATVLLKGKEDIITQGDRTETITGGNAGMTKGGTGDVLAGLVAGLYTMTDDPFAAAVVGSAVCKRAGDALYTQVGPFFPTSDLVKQIPKELAALLY